MTQLHHNKNDECKKKYTYRKETLEQLLLKKNYSIESYTHNIDILYFLKRSIKRSISIYFCHDWTKVDDQVLMNIKFHLFIGWKKEDMLNLEEMDEQ